MDVTDRGWWAFVCDVPRGSSPAAWVVSWLPVGRRHVWLARRVDDGSGPEIWITLDPSASALRTAVAVSQYGYVSERVRAGAVAIRLGDGADPTRAYFRGWMTCVAVAKYAAGLRWPLVLTPGGLIRRAKREGMEVRCTSR